MMVKTEKATKRLLEGVLILSYISIWGPRVKGASAGGMPHINFGDFIYMLFRD